MSYIGYISDTITIINQSYLTIQLKETTNTSEVEIKADRPDTFIPSFDPIKTEVITQTELTKGACCDLAGCFNSQGTVQVTTTNIVTNEKELRILGLSGVYNHILIDGMPLIQGLTTTYSISTFQGPIIDKIYVSKGANSVLQGYESISGQINVIPKSPDNAEKIMVNGFMNHFLEKQLNINFGRKWKKWSTFFAARTTQPEFYIKTGYRFNNTHHIVIFASTFLHDQISYFGTTRYKASQISAYTNIQHGYTQ